ncbi:helix-turn-helix transcriptional regulator [Amycolatopsis sp. OK19-0408]|uniref:Helix-turn-helix transcriptional regulator n=1 Tax=Amycolatopsis iheyensis TaxID=2945988 RepID=A0A9X2NHQ7_9PSEU|nr:helix-turn-helix domain-containing protein [Amycolatopsis iheyensis]MCR6484995.1 helix-turn-helix transcriptional regulator [Amycolatopsis iheyensis]
MSQEVMTLAGRRADRDGWSAAGWCPIERALELVGTRSAMVLLREVYFGGRRFDELVRHAGVTEAVAAKRLKQLVEAGVLARTPYREPGQRVRYEYVLTERGGELFPLLLGLKRFGEQLPREEPGELRLTHAGCGARVESQVRCEAGHEVPPGETVARVVNLRD